MSFRAGEIANSISDIRAYGSTDGIILKYDLRATTKPIPMNVEFLNAILDLENPDADEESHRWQEGWWWK